MEQLKLENQICFPIYTASKVIDRVYRPLLNRFGINYLQYLILLMLFEEKEVTPHRIAKRLDESPGTLVPLLHSLEETGYANLHKEGDEIMKVVISDLGEKLEGELSCVPREVAQKTGFSVERLHSLQLELSALIRNFNGETEEANNLSIN